MPMLPLAPDLFSTTICCCRLRDKYSPMRRGATAGGTPPGGGGEKGNGRGGPPLALRARGGGRVRPLLRLRGGDGEEESQERDDKAQLHHWKMVPLSVWLIDYPTGRSPLPPAATPRSRSLHAVLHLSPRAHGLDSAHAIRALCRRRVRRADLDLHRGHVRHR